MDTPQTVTTTRAPAVLKMCFEYHIILTTSLKDSPIMMVYYIAPPLQNVPIRTNIQYCYDVCLQVFSSYYIFTSCAHVHIKSASYGRLFCTSHQSVKKVLRLSLVNCLLFFLCCKVCHICLCSLNKSSERGFDLFLLHPVPILGQKGSFTLLILVILCKFLGFVCKCQAFLRVLCNFFRY